MSDDLCNMKIKAVRDLAKEKNVNVRDSKGKLKSKCQLIIDVIKKIYSALLPDEIDLSNENIETEYDDEIDLSDLNVEIEKAQPKVTRFGNVTETIVETENEPGRKKKNRTSTRRTLTEEEIKNFKPSKSSKMTSKKTIAQKARERYEKYENDLMSMEDVNVKPKIKRNDFNRYSIMSINNIRYARKKNDSGPMFELFKVKDFRTPSDFSVSSSPNPIAMYDAIDKRLILSKKR